MHRTEHVKPRLWLLAAIAAVVTGAGLLPMFGGTAYAAGVNVNQSVAVSEFVIPGTPVARTVLAVDAVTQPLFNLKVNSTGGFPPSGQLLVSDGLWGDGDKNGAEIMTYSAIKGAIGPGSITNPIELPASLKVKTKGCNPATFKVITVNVVYKTVPPLAGQTVYWNEDPTDDPPQGPGCLEQQGFYRIIIVAGGTLTMNKLTNPPCTNIVSSIPPKDDRLYEVHCGFTITERGPQKPTNPAMIKKAHPAGSKVKLATVTEAPVTATDGPQTTLVDGDLGMAGNNNITNIRGGCTKPAGETFATNCPSPLGAASFLIQLTSTAGFPTTGSISIGHQDVQTSNLLNGQAGEMMEYDMVGAGVNQIRIIRRAIQPTNRAYVHRPTGYAQPSQVANMAGHPGVTKVSVHFQMNVKSAVGFFPAGGLLVCNAGNPLPLTTCELIGHNNRVTKIKTPTEDGAGGLQDQFHMTGRCAAAGTYNKSPGGDGPCPNPVHPTGSIVTGADGFLRCRNGSSQPGVDTNLGMGGIQEPPAQMPGTSVGVTAVCYAQGQPKDGPTKPAQIVGHDLNVINSIAGQPFLSTGGFTHVILGPVPHVDTNGTTDGVLSLTSACIPDFTPGINLQVSSTSVADKTPLGTNTGTIRVVLDAFHDNIDGNADDCDDAAGEDVTTSTTYDSVLGEPGNDGIDDDTDRDGCLDERELRPVLNQGGIRDPWNPYDWYDINHDGAVAVTSDLLQIALANGAGNPNYAPRKDRGVLGYGPFGWNKSAPNGNIDITSDVLGAAQQVSQPCLGHDPDPTTATHESYDVGAAWPAGDRPWYCVAPQVCNSAAAPAIPNHGP